MRRLQHVAKMAVQPQLGSFPCISSVDKKHAFRRFIEAADQVDQRGFAGAGLADDRDIAAMRNFEVEVLEHILLAVRIAECHIPEFDVSAQRLPVFPLWREAVSISLYDFRRIRDVRRLREEIGQALYIDLDRNEGRYVLDDELQRLHHAHCIGDKDGKGSDPDDPLSCHDAALPQYYGKRRRGHQCDRGDQHCRIAHCADRLFSYGLRVRLKLPLHFLFHAEELDGSGAGDPLIEISRDPGVHLADHAVDRDEFLLEQRDQESRHREERDHPQSQLQISPAHDKDREQNIGAVPDTVHHPPGDRFADLTCIAHDTGVNITDTVLVKVREGQRLNMMEGFVSEIPVNRHLHGARVDHSPVVDHRLKEEYSDIEHNKGREALQRAFRNKMVQHIPVKERIGHVDHTADQGKEDHPGDPAPVRIQIG